MPNTWLARDQFSFLYVTDVDTGQGILSHCADVPPESPLNIEL